MSERHSPSAGTFTLPRHESAHDDWLYLGNGDRIHRIAQIEWVGGSPDAEARGHGFALCGLGGEFWIPGFLSRMGQERCARCCERLGIPRGKGNTLNARIKEPISV